VRPRQQHQTSSEDQRSRTARTQRVVQRDERRGARGIDADHRALDAEHKGQSAGGDGDGASRGRVDALVVCAERGKVGIHDAEVHANVCPQQLISPGSRRVEGAVAVLEQQPLLRVHGLRL
jgi:hypothetical protein